MCRVRGWNLLYESLSSLEAREKLRQLRATDPDFWNELTVKTSHSMLPGPDDNVAEDIIPLETDDDDFGDDSSVGVGAVVFDLVKMGTEDGRKRAGGGLLHDVLAEEDEEEPVSSTLLVNEADSSHTNDSAEDTVGGLTAGADNEEVMASRGVGKRKQIPNQRYQLKDFMRHNDDEPWDID